MLVKTLVNWAAGARTHTRAPTQRSRTQANKHKYAPSTHQVHSKWPPDARLATAACSNASDGRQLLEGACAPASIGHCAIKYSTLHPHMSTCVFTIYSLALQHRRAFAFVHGMYLHGYCTSSYVILFNLTSFNLD